MILSTLMNFVVLASNAGDDITYGEAGLNTAMGLGIVFCALAFISLVISLEGKIFGAVGKKKAAPKTPEVPAAPAVVEEVQDESDDTELVAVITAAIYAYEAENGGEIPADGLVVRSIRRLGYAR